MMMVSHFLREKVYRIELTCMRALMRNSGFPMAAPTAPLAAPAAIDVRGI